MARILIADDDDIYREAFCTGLQELQHDVDGVPSGAEVLPSLTAKQYDIVFLDVMMAGGGAITVLHQVRDHDPKIPVVIITGRTELIGSPLFREGMRSAQAKVLKTATLSELHRMIESLVA